jgi:hypothetical protein
MRSLQDSEAGLMLMAEMLGIMSQKVIMRLLIKIAYGYPVHKSEIVDDRVERKALNFLLDEGHVLQLWGKRDGESRRKKYLFPSDEFTRPIFDEVISLLQRQHEERAIAFARLKRDLGRWR